MKSELVISTFNKPVSLDLCFQSVTSQDHVLSSICIADYGSGPATRAVIEAFAKESKVPVRHVWHEDNGFEKGAILNKAIASSAADYLIFIDGDVMISPGFVRRHVLLARRGWFNSGSLIRLDKLTTAAVTRPMVKDMTVFRTDWLKETKSFRGISSWLKAATLPFWMLNALERRTPIRCSFCGANSSAYRDDIIAVNGYDERIKYGGQDKELGERMKNAGVRGRHVRYTAPLVHLDHPRGYDRPEIRAVNRKIRAETKANRATFTAYGIHKDLQSSAPPKSH
jgi:glycosyltransferase involved in cell wall biosynthesis